MDVFCTDTSAVRVRNVHVQYSSKVKVLDNVCLEIPEGKIFALLGPNGVGKTTLIRAIIGIIKVNSGSVLVFGRRPGDKQSHVPGVGVGYMPQDLALFESLSINEILVYYSMIYHMNSEETEQRIEELIDILNLPEKSRSIDSLSGGQQRLVSIAVTLIHRPKLIVLDEPTVGVDSLLRHKIWNYLENICSTNGQTVIITTHYIEEAKSASNVAFMIAGTVLRQSNPQKLLHEYNCQTLEEVFLKICDRNEDKNHWENETQIAVSLRQLTLNEKCNENDLKHLNRFSLIRVEAIVWKYFLLVYKRPIFVFIYFFLPLLTVFSIRTSLSNYPHHLPVAIFNQETHPRHSQTFIDSFDRKYITVNEYTDNRTAFESVVSGHNYMSIVFSKNYSESLENRYSDADDMSADEIRDSDIKLYIDLTHYPISTYIIIRTIEAFYKMLDQLSANKTIDSFKTQTYIEIKETIYGDIAFKRPSPLFPALMLLNVELVLKIISAFQIIVAKINSCSERTFVAGVKPMEYYLAHVVYSVILILMQVILIMVIILTLVDNTLVGSYLDVFLILFIQGLIGMSFGVLFGLLRSDLISAFVLICGLLFVLFFMSGIIWPIEAVPDFVRTIDNCNQLSKASQALLAVMYKGRQFTNAVVLNGYTISLIYLVIINTLNVVLFHKYSH